MEIDFDKKRIFGIEFNFFENGITSFCGDIFVMSEEMKTLCEEFQNEARKIYNEARND